jgi:hypothetical protein
MYWVIRWAEGDDDRAAVIEAETRAAAECAALKRNIPVVFVGEADEYDLRDARRARLLWKYTPDPRHTCLGRPVGGFQLACFMLAGTMTVLLHVNRVLQTSGLLPAVRHWIA